MDDKTKTLRLALAKLLKPLIKVLLRNGMPFGEFTDIAKQMYIEVAYDDFSLSGRKQSASRVSVITGINRKDVAQAIKRSSELPSATTGLNRNRAFRIVNGWILDERFTDEDGNPMALNLVDEPPSFNQLVKEYSVDVSVRVLMDELIRAGTVRKNTSDNTVSLLNNSYVPNLDSIEQLRIFGDATYDLLSTIDHNLQPEHTKKQIQRTVSYDSIDVSKLEFLQAASEDKIKGFLAEFGQWLSQYDEDMNPDITVEKRARAGIGVYYIQESINEEEEK